MTTVASLDPIERKHVARRRVVLVGQPNVGKSVLFNALTGHYVAVSNYPGTTVDVSRGLSHIGSEALEMIDSPGIQSLVAQSDEERVTRSLLLTRPDVIIQVANSRHLTRALTLTLELAELGLPMVLCLNMKDEATSRGFHVDVPRLAKVLGMPVVETVATTREGLDGLQKAIARASKPHWQAIYTAEVQSTLEELRSTMPVDYHVLCPLLLQNHASLKDLAESHVHLTDEQHRRFQTAQERFYRPVSRIMAETRQEQSKILTADVLQAPADSVGGSSFLDGLGRWCLRPWPGFLIAIGVLWLCYQFVAVFGAGTAVDFLEGTIFGQYVNPWLTRLVQGTIPWRPVQDILVGEFGVLTMAMTYALALLLPIITTFFLAMGFLEDSGYLPRLSVLLDRFFKLMGLNGKAIFPVILGLGCGTMAMLSTRILDTKKEKLLVSLLLALAVPCSAQLAVVLAMTAGVSGMVFAIWFAVMGGTLLGTGWLASKVLPGAASPFFLEIPPLRVPQISNLLSKVRTRLTWYVKEVVPLFALASLLLWALNAIGWLAAIQRLASPLVVEFLGLPAKATDAFIIGFLRRDYGAAGLYQLQQAGLLSLRQTTVSLVAMTLFMPCIAQGMVALRERGLKVTLVIGGVVVGYAVLVAGAINRILLLAGWA